MSARAVRALAIAACVVLAAVAAVALRGAPAMAQGNSQVTITPTLAPWRPAGLDSLRLWGLEAHARLADSQSDTVGPNEQRAFELLDRAMRSTLRGLGPKGMRGAPGVLAVFDSLKLDVEIAQDPKWPQFVVATYFNPSFAGHACWTTIFWWRGNDLLSQSMILQGGRNAQVAVWWTGNDLGPYEMGIVDYRRTGDPREGYFSMLRLSRNADFWGAVQYGKKSFSLGGPGPARFVDLNGDGVPELVNWSVSPPDPRFVADQFLPPLLAESSWMRTDDGFAPLDHRTLPTPFATWVLFLRALTGGQTALARSLCATPEPMLSAQRLKLGLVSAKNSWHVGETPNPDPWRERFAFGYGTPGRREHECRVELTEVQGHWLIASIKAPRVSVPPGATP